MDRARLTIRQVYQERRDIMLDELAKNMPEGVTWTHPLGGLFLWVTLPEYMDTNIILKDAVAEKVAFVPGDSFYPFGGGSNAMRLNFSNAKPEKIREGIQRLSRVVKKYLK
mgnify:FL=1